MRKRRGPAALSRGNPFRLRDGSPIQFVARVFGFHDSDLLGVVDFDSRNVPYDAYGAGGTNCLVLEVNGRIVDAGFLHLRSSHLGNDDREVFLVAEIRFGIMI